MDLQIAIVNALYEMNNIHREYLAGRNGGCPCLTKAEACPLDRAIHDLAEAAEEAGYALQGMQG